MRAVGATRVGELKTIWRAVGATRKGEQARVVTRACKAYRPKADSRAHRECQIVHHWLMDIAIEAF